MIAFIAQLPVRIIFNDRNPVFVSQFDQLFSSLEAEGDSAWILKIGQNVHELRSDAKRGFKKGI